MMQGNSLTYHLIFLQEIVAHSLASVGLSGVEDLMPSELSGGMKKRVALARAIVRDVDSNNPDQVFPAHFELPPFTKDCRCSLQDEWNKFH